MAILTGGLLGKSRKAIGDLVTYVSGGQQIARMKASSYKDANSDDQKLQRNAFVLILGLFRILMASVKVGFPERQSKHSAYNAFMMYNTPEAVSGALGSQVIDYSEIVTSKGSLLKASGALVDSSITDRVDITWDDNSNATTGFTTDKAVISVYNPVKDEVTTSLFDVTRQTEARNITVPSAWQGDTVHAWLSFVSNDNAKASDSVYIGSVTVSA
ncbi:MAG: hypothetical protein GXO80_12000 [Chlorobi bacterium]|nr:hypothetical protein [Chlorobiota bacterium]